MIIVLAIDALEYELVEKFNCENLKQKFYGKTDISEFSEPRTIVLWSSFITGKNKEREILAKSKEEMWYTNFSIEETFFSYFQNPAIFDLPGFNYDQEVHNHSRTLLKKIFEVKSPEEKEGIKKEYNQEAFEHHRKIKNRFFEALNKDHDFILGYFSIIDVIGHLNFGNSLLMKMLYTDMDDLADKCAEKNCPLLILSDHGMQAVGMFGDHSEYGFWSLNVDKNFNTPKITDFKDVIKSLR